jgi:hypothetical protein
VTQLYPRELGFLYVISYDLKGYGEGILTLHQPGGPGPRIYIYIYIYILQEQVSQSVCKLANVKLIFQYSGSQSAGNQSVTEIG